MKKTGLDKLDNFVENEIDRRTSVGKDLAKRYPELKGLSYEEFLDKLPLDLDFITATEMFEALQVI